MTLEEQYESETGKKAIGKTKAYLKDYVKWLEGKGEEFEKFKKERPNLFPDNQAQRMNGEDHDR